LFLPGNKTFKRWLRLFIYKFRLFPLTIVSLYLTFFFFSNCDFYIAEIVSQFRIGTLLFFRLYFFIDLYLAVASKHSALFSELWDINAIVSHNVWILSKSEKKKAVTETSFHISTKLYNKILNDVTFLAFKWGLFSLQRWRHLQFFMGRSEVWRGQG